MLKLSLHTECCSLSSPMSLVIKSDTDLHVFYVLSECHKAVTYKTLPKPIVCFEILQEALANFLFQNVPIWRPALFIQQQQRITMTNKFIHLVKCTPRNQSVSQCNGIMVQCNCKGSLNCGVLLWMTVMGSLLDRVMDNLHSTVLYST